jgi:hypothetical protein
MTADRLAEALRSIKAATHWYFVCGGAVSHEDVRAMMTAVKRELEGVHDLLFDQALPDPECEKQSPTMNNDF